MKIREIRVMAVGQGSLCWRLRLLGVARKCRGALAEPKDACARQTTTEVAALAIAAI